MGMKGQDLYNLLFLVSKDNLLLGANFFNKEKIVNFINDLPKDQIVNMLKSLFLIKNF